MKLETEELDGGVLKVRLWGRMDIVGVDAIAVPFAGLAATDDRRGPLTAPPSAVGSGPHRVVVFVAFLLAVLVAVFVALVAHGRKGKRLVRFNPTDPPVLVHVVVRHRPPPQAQICLHAATAP